MLWGIIRLSLTERLKKLGVEIPQGLRAANRKTRREILKKMARDLKRNPDRTVKLVRAPRKKKAELPPAPVVGADNNNDARA